MNKIILFQKKQKKDTIDVWWLSDDGGKYGEQKSLLDLHYIFFRPTML